MNREEAMAHGIDSPLRKPIVVCDYAKIVICKQFTTREGLGDVDMIWGSEEDHEGFEHLAAEHIIEADDFETPEQMMIVIDDVIKNGKLARPMSKDKAINEKDGYIVYLKRQYRDKATGDVLGKKKYVVTAFDISRKEHEKKTGRKFLSLGGSPRETLTAPSSSHKVDGVTLPSSEHSNGKGTDNSANDQIITGNSAVDDEKYMQAVQNGDVETAQKMVLAKDDAELGEENENTRNKFQ